MRNPNNLTEARQGARLAAVQALFVMQQTGNSLFSAMQAFNSDEFGLDEEGHALADTDPELFKNILEVVIEHQSDVDAYIQAHLKAGWRIDRLDSVSLSILRAATAELIAFEYLATATILSEYVSLSYAYFDDPEPQFINGCLDKIAKTIRA